MFKLGMGEPPGFERVKILWTASLSVLITMQSRPELSPLPWFFRA